MNNQEVIISGVHVDLTDSLKSVVRDKVYKLFNHDGKIIRVRVTLEMSKNKAHQDEFIAHGRVEIGGPDLEARAATEDLYKSIDAMINKLDRQLIDVHKTKQGKRKN
ncbi:MAG: ribosome-associated translation inhibitor RaiA [Puniceicoccales bacterium]|jgi:putative sigma-54 modulation protein|nr:ribosome-associated translation inhibitor RaiA [Puniceicoccales bacterium]